MESIKWNSFKIKWTAIVVWVYEKYQLFYAILKITVNEVHSWI